MTLVQHFLYRAAVSPRKILIPLMAYFTAGLIVSPFRLRSTKQTLRNHPTN
jgi:hypothetical protein